MDRQIIPLPPMTTASLLLHRADEGVDDIELVGVDGGQAVGQAPDVNAALGVTTSDEARIGPVNVGHVQV